MLALHFLNSIHVRDCKLKGFPDQDIWEYARLNGFIIVSKDSDFYQRRLLYGQPPKVIWLRISHCTRNDLVNLIIKYKEQINTFNNHPSESILIKVC